MIQLAAVAKTFNAGRRNSHTALRSIDMTVEPGRVTVFQGPSGSGKTTLLSIIGCMVRPSSGRVRLKGRDTTGLPERFLSQIRRQSFGFVFQDFHLIPGASVLENVLLPTYPTTQSPHHARRRAESLLGSLGILSRAKEPAHHLSGGEQQRVAIARALINDPEFVIADEPTAHLDTQLALQFLQIIAALKAQGKTLLLASHDPVLCDSDVIDRVVELRDGSIVGEA